jgi:hypothetical protein
MEHDFKLQKKTFLGSESKSASGVSKEYNLGSERIPIHNSGGGGGESVY